MKYLFLFLFLTAFSLMPTGLRAQSFQTRSISVFKNGTVFFDKTAEVAVTDGRTRIQALPVTPPETTDVPPLRYPAAPEVVHPILFGTLFFSAPGNDLLQVTSWTEEEKTLQAFATLDGLLTGNPDKRVRLWLRDRSQPLEGTIFTGQTAAEPAQNTFVIIRSDDRWHSVTFSEITNVEFLDAPSLNRSVTQHRPVVELAFRNPVARQPVQLMYLQKGITWTPQYALRLLGDQKARLTLTASLVNDIEDLNEVEVNFVVGVPAFRFGFAVDPLLASQSVAQLLRTLQNEPREEDIIMTNMVTAQRLAVQPDEGLYPSGTEAQTEGSLGEDLFFYRREKITLPKGGRMQVPLLSTEVTYEDIYSVELESNSRRSGYYQEMEERENRVWHALKFRNETDFPFTTGSIFFQRREAGQTLPVSQNQLDFTPSGAAARVNMTIVPDVAVRDWEGEVDRRPNARKSYDLVTVEGTIEIANFKDQPIDLQVGRSLTGEPLSSEHPWTTESVARRLDKPNQQFNLRWAVSLQAGERKTFTYRYQVYVN